MSSVAEQIQRYFYDVKILKKPFNGELDESAQTLSEILDTLCLPFSCEWSFCGGFARDLYLGYEPNDFDIAVQYSDSIRSQLLEMGLLSLSLPEIGVDRPHEVFHNPYIFQSSGHPVHFIPADDHKGYAPSHFDFSINHICLKSDGYFYAPSFAWRDLERKVIRRVADRLTDNMVYRAIRFAVRYGFTIEEEFEKEILDIIKEPMDTKKTIYNFRKMIESNLADECYQLMKTYDFSVLDGVDSLGEAIEQLQPLIGTDLEIIHGGSTDGY